MLPDITHNIGMWIQHCPMRKIQLLWDPATKAIRRPYLVSWFIGKQHLADEGQNVCWSEVTHGIISCIECTSGPKLSWSHPSHKPVPSKAISSRVNYIQQFVTCGSPSCIMRLMTTWLSIPRPRRTVTSYNVSVASVMKLWKVCVSCRQSSTNAVTNAWSVVIVLRRAK